VLDDENMSGLDAVDTGPISLLEAEEIRGFVPPRIDVRRGKPALQQRKVAPFKCAE
jgi:hypothetical protein